MKQLILLLILIIPLKGLSQTEINLKEYKQIPDSFRYDNILIEQILLDYDSFYWEYRYRDMHGLHDLFIKYRDNLDKLKDSLKTNYKIILKSKRTIKLDSIKISIINTYQGFKSCIPEPSCIYYIVYVKNDSIIVIDNPKALRRFILPIDNYKKAILWSIWEGYTFSQGLDWSGFYKIEKSDYRLIMQKTIESKQLEDKTWEDKIGIVELIINKAGKISEKQIDVKTWKYEFKILN